MNLTILTTDIRSEQDVMLTRQRARQIAGLLDFDMQDQTRIATAVSEIARNAVQHAEGGRVEFLLVNSTPQMLRVRIRDEGCGIADIGSLLRPDNRTFSERGNSLRGVRQLVDEFLIESTAAKGTLVTLGKQRSILLPRIERKEMAQITQSLMQRVSEDPLAEMQRQNQELLHTLEELRVQQEVRAEYLKEIETLNGRLKRSVQATNHRVKNNLQIISALVELQVDPTDEQVPAEALLRIGRHARSLAVLHDMLTQETQANFETEVLSVQSALSKLMPLFEATTGGRRIVSHIEALTLPIQKGASLALLISELISNAIKHGSNDIAVSLTVTHDIARLEVCNDGRGFPVDFDWRKAANIGLNIIDSTGRHDLRGTISYENRPEGGARVSVTFPTNTEQ